MASDLHVGTLQTPNGDEMVALPRAEYERLIEERGMTRDVTIYDRFHERLVRGEDERIPSEIVDRLLDGENKVKVWRAHRGYRRDSWPKRPGSARAMFPRSNPAGKKEASRR